MRWSWKRREQPVEGLLKANRPEPRDEFARSVIARVDGARRRPAGRGLRGRLVLAGVVTALAAGGAVAAGAFQSVSNGAGSLASAAHRSVTPAQHVVQSASPVLRVELTPAGSPTGGSTPGSVGTAGGGSQAESATGGSASGGAGTTDGGSQAGSLPSAGSPKSDSSSSAGTTGPSGGGSSSGGGTVTPVPSVVVERSSSAVGGGGSTDVQLLVNGTSYRTTAHHHDGGSSGDEQYEDAICISVPGWPSYTVYVSSGLAAWLVATFPKYVSYGVCGT